MKPNFRDEIVLVVCSCDKYKSAWKPYFSLLQIYWKTHPDKIYLISETQTYFHEGLNIQTCNYGVNTRWSERLINALKEIESKYIIFTLEDFFLLGPVKQERIDECYFWMEQNPQIAGIRLWGQNSDQLYPLEPYGEFYATEDNKPYRVDAQVTLWNRESFLSFLDPSEDPWTFEQMASKRSADSGKIILWHYMQNDDNPLERIVPYDFRTVCGYGITWGGWLWKNQGWFEKHGITDVDYSQIGILSEKVVSRRIRFLYKPNRSGWEKFIGVFWQIGVKGKKAVQLGPRNTVKKLLKLLEKK